MFVKMYVCEDKGVCVVCVRVCVVCEGVCVRVCVVCEGVCVRVCVVCEGVCVRVCVVCEGVCVREILFKFRINNSRNYICL